MLDRKKYVEELVNAAQFLRSKASVISGGLKDWDVTPSQWLVVSHVFQNEWASTRETAEALRMTGSAVTQLVNGLVASGRMAREPNPRDRRAHRLTLSEESKKQIALFKEERVRIMLDMFRALTDEEFEQYLVLHKKILAFTASR